MICFFLRCEGLDANIERLFVVGSLRRRFATGNVEVLCRVLSTDG